MQVLTWPRNLVRSLMRTSGKQVPPTSKPAPQGAGNPLHPRTKQAILGWKPVWNAGWASAIFGGRGSTCCEAVARSWFPNIASIGRKWPGGRTGRSTYLERFGERTA